MDWYKFRTYLKEKHAVTTAYIFIGYIHTQEELYTFLQEAGFVLIFKETQKRSDGSSKGNVDAELVLHSMIEYPNYDKAVIITGDGDFACLVRYLNKQNKLQMLLVPNEDKYSALLKKAAANRIAPISALQKRLEYVPK